MEMIDIYNDLGQKIDVSIEKEEAHRKALIHKGVCVWIMNSKNEILLQRRSSQVMFPKMLDISFSGHIKSGETSIEAAIREGKEELGISIDLDKLRYLFTCREYGGVEGYFENEIDDVFLYSSDICLEEFSFCDEEVESVKYVSLSQFLRMVDEKDKNLLPYEMHYTCLIRALKSGVLKEFTG